VSAQLDTQGATVKIKKLVLLDSLEIVVRTLESHMELLEAACVDARLVTLEITVRLRLHVKVDIMGFHVKMVAQ